MKKIFRNYTFKWWQVALLKFALLAIGLAIGSHWASVFAPYFTHLLIGGLIVAVYVRVTTFNQ
jgi:hypothetical protein